MHGGVFFVTSFLVSSSHEAFVEENRWYGEGGGAIVESVYCSIIPIFPTNGVEPLARVTLYPADERALGDLFRRSVGYDSIA